MDELQLSELPACPLCLLDAAFEIRDAGKPRTGTLTRTVNWVYREIELDLEAAVVQARLREAPRAEDALRDLRERRVRSPLVRVVVERLARQIADEIARSELA